MRIEVAALDLFFAESVIAPNGLRRRLMVPRKVFGAFTSTDDIAVMESEYKDAIAGALDRLQACGSCPIY